MISRALHLSRRRFLKLGLAAAAPMIIPSSALGTSGRTAPSNRIVMGAIGIGGMGGYDLQGFLGHEEVQVVAVCDVDAHRLAGAKRMVDHRYGYSDCAPYNEHERILERKDIDAVLIATPDHWHVPLAIAAARAGKDMYCEKPISVAVAEGRAVVETMKRYQRIYQSGTQRRSIGAFRFAVETARGGKLGRIHTVRTYLSRGPSCPPQPVAPVPEHFDYERWLGPAPWAPYTPLRCHGSFRWVSDYSGGQLTDIGAHFNDLAQWGLDREHTGPVSYEGRAEFPTDGLFDTPMRYEITCTYADGVKLIMHDGDPRAVRFEGEEGWVSVDDDGVVLAEPKSILAGQRIVRQSYSYMTGHHTNFLECVRTRATPIAPPEVAHRSTTICHLGNLCLRRGKRLEWDPVAERVTNDDAANRMLERAGRWPWGVS